MHQRSLRALRSALVLVLVVSCGTTVETVVTNPSSAPRGSKYPSEVDVYSGSIPQRPYSEVGIIKAQQESVYSTASMSDIITTLTACGGHAVCIVGYTRKRFTIRNSWGKDWGEQGFAYATDEYVSAAFSEAYGAVL